VRITLLHSLNCCFFGVDDTLAGIGRALAVKLLELGNTVSLLPSFLSLNQYKCFAMWAPS
jgi:hypothetical protein